MVSSIRAYNQIIQEGLAHYWRVCYSKTDKGLKDYELKLKRDHERDMERMERLWGDKWEKQFGNKSGE